jgi:hypothetical protein
MLTYQLQRRTFKCENAAEFKFPGCVTVEFHFEPQEPFGTRHGDSRTALRAVPATAFINRNNGRCLIRSERPLALLEAGVHYDDVNFDFRGNKLFIERRCETQDELAQLIYSVQGLLPPLLNVFLPDAPFITCICGSVGTAKFSWELVDTQFQTITTKMSRRNALPLPCLYTGLALEIIRTAFMLHWVISTKPVDCSRLEMVRGSLCQKPYSIFLRVWKSCST